MRKKRLVRRHKEIKDQELREIFYLLTKFIRISEEKSGKAVKIEVAKGLVKAGVSAHVISRTTNLSISEYEEKKISIPYKVGQRIKEWRLRREYTQEDLANKVGSEENGILKDILKKRIIIKHSNGEETTYTPFTYAEACENSEAVEEILKFSGELVNRRATQQPTVVTAETTTAKDENSKEVCKYSVTNKGTTHAIDKATETDTKLCESEDLQPICESNEEAQIETTVEPTSVDRADRPSSAELYFDNKENSADEKSSKRAIQPIVAGVAGAVLLVSCVASYLMIESSKVHVIAVIGVIVGLVCMCFALYNAIKPNTKLEKMEDIEQLDPQNLKTSCMLERP